MKISFINEKLVFVKAGVPQGSFILYIYICENDIVDDFKSLAMTFVDDTSY